MSSATGRRQETEPQPLEPADIHDVLRNDRRRLVLERLRSTESSEPVRDLAEHIAVIEAGESPAPRNVRQSVYVSLQQTHLPKLDELDIVAYDADAKEVSLGPRASEVAAFLDHESESTRTCEPAVVAAGAGGFLLVVAAALGVPGLAALGPAVVGGASLLAVAGIGGYHLARDRGLLDFKE